MTVLPDGQPQAPKAKRSEMVAPPVFREFHRALDAEIHLQRRCAAGTGPCDEPGPADASDGFNFTVTIDGEPLAPGRKKRDVDAGPVGQIADGQIQNQPAAPPVSPAGSPCHASPSSEVPHVTAIADGQPQAPKAKRDVDGGPVNQIADGQIQNQPTASTVSSAVSPCHASASEAAHVTVIADGQPQAPKVKRDNAGGPANQIADGQVQNQPTAAPVSSVEPACGASSSEVPHVTVIADGQPQAPKMKRDQGPVNQIADGQVQNQPTAAPVSSMEPACCASSSEVPHVTVIADGQPQAPKIKRDNRPANQIADGQVQNQPAAPPVSSVGPACHASSEVSPVTAIADGQPQAPKGKRNNGPVNQIADGQVQNQPTASPVSSVGPACHASSEVSHVTAIADGQPQAPKAKRDNGPVNQIADGQVQNQPMTAPVSSASPACHVASEVPHVTAIADGQPQAPKVKRDHAVQGMDDVAGARRYFVRHGALSTRDVEQIADGQVQNEPQAQNVHAVHQIADGQIQNAHPVNQIVDGQIQNAQPVQQVGECPIQKSNPVNQIGDGQIQNQPLPTSTPTTAPASPCTYPLPGFGNGTIGYNTTKCGMPPSPHVTAIADGQPQAPANHLPRPGPFRVFDRATHNKVNEIFHKFAAKARQVWAALHSTKPSARSIPTGADARVVRHAPRSVDAAANTEAAAIAGADADATANDGAPPRLYTCAGKGTLRMTLADGVLKDGLGRTGYIADNYQFQFDAPPQAGALVTAGFSMCDDGRLALGDRTAWWQCASGDFYNLYDRKWAPHCEAVEFRALEIVEC